MSKNQSGTCPNQQGVLIIVQISINVTVRTVRTVISVSCASKAGYLSCFSEENHGLMGISIDSSEASGRFQQGGVL